MRPARARKQFLSYLWSGIVNNCLVSTPAGLITTHFFTRDHKRPGWGRLKTVCSRRLIRAKQSFTCSDHVRDFCPTRSFTRCYAIAVQPAEAVFHCICEIRWPPDAGRADKANVRLTTCNVCFRILTLPHTRLCRSLGNADRQGNTTPRIICPAEFIISSHVRIPRATNQMTHRYV